MPEQLVNLVRRRVSHRVRHVERRRPARRGHRKRFDQEVALDSDRIICRKFEIIRMLAREGDGGQDLLPNLGSRELPRHPTTVRAGTEAYMDISTPPVCPRRTLAPNHPRAI